MPKEITIALKDMTQSLRSLFAIMFMFVIPILMTGMFSLMFGGSDEEEPGFVLPITRVLLVNQDTGNFDNPANLTGNLDAAGINSIGQMFTMLLHSEGLRDLMTVSEIADEAVAKLAIDNQEAGIAVILPENLTETYMTPDGNVTIEVYQDPTLTIGPAIIKGIISQFLDNFSGSKITLAVSLEQIESASQPLDEAQIQAVIAQYLATIQTENGSQQSEGGNPYLEIRAPHTEKKATGQSINSLAMIMAGMSIFYIFFTGASGAQAILVEEEKGTLPRLFTTPTTTATILRGKFLSIALTILVQITVLLGFGYAVFKINWGDLISVGLLSTAITLAATAFGIFLISWMKTTRQAGFMIGGLGTIFGMAGMMPIFTMAMPNPPAFIQTISYFTPHGWAVQGLQTTMTGGTLPDVATNILALLGWTLVLFAIGIIRFRKRFY